MPRDSSWKRQFASDTVAGVCPEALEALSAANRVGFVSSYGGDDEFTGQATRCLFQLFGKNESNCQVFFVSSGTAANALAISALCQSFDGILCHPLSHLENDEANAPEHLTGGAKLLHVPGRDGQLAPDQLADWLDRGHGPHSARMRMISITQATEVGTVYSLDALVSLVKCKQQIESVLQQRYQDPHYQLYLHMDGARFANAVAFLHCDPRELISAVDVLSFGGSKNGGPPTEAVLFFNPTLAQTFAWRLKQAGQLISKMRYLSAPWLGLLQDGIWLKNGRHANAQAQSLSTRFQELGLEPAFPVQANMVFLRLSPEQAASLQRLGWQFYPFHVPEGIVYRFVCNWGTEDEAIDDLIADCKTMLAR